MLSTSSVYRYDGTGNGTFLSSIGTGDPIFDIATDNQGNYYLFFTSINKIIAYNPNGIPIDTFITTGNTVGGDCGFALLGGRAYYGDCNLSSGLYEGIKTGDTINFSLIKSYTVNFRDMAACPDAAAPLAVFKNPEQPHFAMYPNPARDQAVIKLDNTDYLEITDCMGVLKLITRVRGFTEYSLEVSTWKPGVYFLKAVSTNKISVRSSFIVYH
jgi:hypothetical protein